MSDNEPWKEDAQTLARRGDRHTYAHLTITAPDGRRWSSVLSLAALAELETMAHAATRDSGDLAHPTSPANVAAALVEGICNER